MISPIFVDTNIPIYAAGRSHPLKEPSAQILMLVGERPWQFMTDAEVLQELLHRYLALQIWPHGREVLIRFAMLMHDRVQPVNAGDVQVASYLANRYQGLSARDLIHAAIMARSGIGRIITADRGFDRVEHIERLDPGNLSAWRDLLNDQPGSQ